MFPSPQFFFGTSGCFIPVVVHRQGLQPVVLPYPASFPEMMSGLIEVPFATCEGKISVKWHQIAESCTIAS